MTTGLPNPIELENASNLRDVGGWRTSEGGRVRPGLIYRASALLELSQADLVTLAGLGIRTVCDLRGSREGTARPVRITGARHEHFPIEPSVGGSLRDILRTGVATGHTSPDDMMALMRDAYRAYALQSFTQYRSLFALLLADDGLPLLFHCAAGKDRTGFGAALILTALGVSWDDVVADYVATNRLWRREFAVFEMAPPLKEVLLSAHPELLMAAFAAIKGAYGSVDTYLEQAIGLGPAERSVLRTHYTT
jgi:protein-tyrosine phosphatase